MSAFPMRRSGPGSDRLIVGAVLCCGLAVAALAGAAAAAGSFVVLGALAWLAVAVLGLRYPVLPFGLTLVPYTVASANSTDNALLKGSEALHDSIAGPVTPSDVVMVAAVAAAVAALARMPAERRPSAWTPLAAPLIALLAAGAFSGFVVHQEGGGAVSVLMPLLRLVTMFSIASVLLASGQLRRPHIAAGGIVAGQVVGALGIYNSAFAGTGENTISETPLPGGEAPVDERTLAFVDAAGPLVMVFALAAILTRTLWSSSRDRWLMLVLGALPFIGLVLSVRRAMWIDFAIAALVIVLVSASVDRRVLVTAVIALSVGGVVFVTLTQSSPAYQERIGGITTVFSSDSSESSIRSRQIETEAVWRNIRDHPIEGIGLTVPYLSNVQFQYQEATYLHNNVLWIWLKFGIIGLLALIWLVWRTVRAGLGQAGGLVRSRSFTPAEASLASTATMLGFFVASLTASFMTASVRPPVIAGVLLAVAGFGALRSSTPRPTSS